MYTQIVSKFWNYIFYLACLYFLIQKGPVVLKNFLMEDKLATEYSVKRLSGEEITFPIQNQKMIVIFWATWCEPCKIELNRMNHFFSKGEIKSHQFLAINLQEDKETVSKFLESNSWQFLVALDETGKIAEKYNVSGTPTTIFFGEDSKIKWISTGLSPFLEYRIHKFLKN